MHATRCVFAGAVKALSSKSYKMSCDSRLTHRTKERSDPTALKNKREARNYGIKHIMALEPQKASAINQNAASEETQRGTAEQKQRVQSEVEETAKKEAKTTKAAREQRDVQPEVEKPPQGFTPIALEAPKAEDDDVRRVSDEFALRWSLEAEQHVKGKSADYVRAVTKSAYERIYKAERALCGETALVVIGRVPPIEKLDKWWTAFPVDDLWFVLKYHDTYIREYELLPAAGPTPGDGGDPPPMRRQQRRPPPARIGPRPRGRRNRSDPQGSRATVERQPPRKIAKKAKKKLRDAKRAIEQLYDRVSWELQMRSDDFSRRATHLWRQKWPRLLRNIVRVKQASGTLVQALRGVCASLVQVRQQADGLASPINQSFTSSAKAETYSASGRLEPCDAGQNIFSRLRLQSWIWNTPPIAWNEYLFGVDWTLNPFGVLEEEQAFT